MVYNQHILPSWLAISAGNHWPCFYTVHVYVVIHFVIVCGLSKWKRICAGYLYRLFIQVLMLEIKLSRRKAWASINWFNPLLYLHCTTFHLKRLIFSVPVTVPSCNGAFTTSIIKLWSVSIPYLIFSVEILQTSFDLLSFRLFMESMSSLLVTVI